MILEILYAIAAYLESVNYGMDSSNYEYWGAWYWALGGAGCTPDLDAVHQARYVVIYLLRVIAYALGVDLQLEYCIVH